ncbi:hypothetical protein D3C85_1225730 [compost metagenome]
MHNGEIKGEISDAPTRNPSFIGKLGFDKQLNNDLRVRLTGSVYHNNGSASNTLYTGDRGGSRYYMVLEPKATGVTAITNAWSGSVRPGFSRQVTAFMINPFIKYQGLEFFGTFEMAKGRAITEIDKRDVSQIAVEGIYRFAKNENLFVGMRYNTVKAELAGIAQDVKVNRIQASAGWFVTKNMVLKGEYVHQKYNDYPSSNIFADGKFKGWMLEASVGF